MPNLWGRRGPDKHCGEEGGGLSFCLYFAYLVICFVLFVLFEGDVVFAEGPVFSRTTRPVSRGGSKGRGGGGGETVVSEGFPGM